MRIVFTRNWLAADALPFLVLLRVDPEKILETAAENLDEDLVFVVPSTC